MNRSYIKKLDLTVCALFSLLLLSCVQEPVQNGLGGYVNEEDYQEQFVNSDAIDIIQEVVEMDTIQLDTSFIDFSNEMIDLLAANELIELSKHFHPQKRCAFVPYTFLSDENQEFTTNSFIKQFDLDEKLMWGTQDGSGDSILYTVSDYIKTYVYDIDFKTKSSDVHINGNLAFSNTLNNISKLYPEAEFVEFYYDGTKEYEGMDWKSLIFYIEKLDDVYYLVAIAHNQWTI